MCVRLTCAWTPRNARKSRILFLVSGEVTQATSPAPRHTFIKPLINMHFYAIAVAIFNIMPGPRAFYLWRFSSIINCEERCCLVKSRGANVSIRNHKTKQFYANFTKRKKMFIWFCIFLTTKRNSSPNHLLWVDRRYNWVAHWEQNPQFFKLVLLILF